VSAGATTQPQSKVELQELKLGKFWTSLSQALYVTLDQALSARERRDLKLDAWNNAYEMRVGQRNWPWPNASNVTTTIIPTQVDTMLANIVLAVYAVQRYYVVNGNTPQAANGQHDVEQGLNAELLRQRPGGSWLYQHIESLFAGLRDGNGITEILYKKEWAEQNIAIVERVQDPDTGIDIVDPLTGQPVIRTRVESQKIPIYDDVALDTVELRDFGVIPAWQTDIDKAAGVWRRSYMDSNELRAMVKTKDNPNGPLRKDAVEYAINFLAPGESDLAHSRQGYSTYTIAGDIDVGMSEGTANAELKQHTGPLDIVRIHTNMFFDGKEYVFWLHPPSETCLGWQRYQYWHGQRPFSVKKPLPRVKRFYGLSLIERLLPSVVEIQANKNRRNDFLDQRTLPPMYELDGAKLLTKNNALGPDARWKLPSADAVGILKLPTDVNLILAGKDEEGLLREDIQEFTGNGSLATGQVPTGRPTKAGIQAAQARMGLRHNFVAMHVRDADMRTINQVIALKIQYGPDTSIVDTNVGGEPKKLIIPKEVLAQDYTITIAGQGGPLDKSTRTQEMQSLYALLMQNPLIGGHPVKIWALTRMLLEEYSRADILELIGTRDEAEQQEKLQQMMQQMGQQPGQQPGGGAPGGGGGHSPSQPAGQ
jgi:hypothetical protein